MDDLGKLLPSKTAITWLASGAVTLVAILAVHKILITDTGLFQEGPPRFAPEYLLLSLFTAVAAFCFCASVLAWRDGAPPGTAHENPVHGKMQWGLIALTLLVSGVFVGIFLASPTRFNVLSLEDGAVEWASALLLFGCSLAFIGVFLRARKLPDNAKALCGGALLLALAFFVIGMEEISWMQRVVGLETGAAFQSNIQGEMNLHNFATEPVELAYYIGAFAFTVALPFMRWKGIFPLERKEFNLLIPRPWVLYVGVVACGYNFDMWNIFLIQGTFWASCVILLYLLLAAPRSRGLTATVLVALVASQTVFLGFDTYYAREWELTEYKEFFMPLAFLAYSLDVLRCSREHIAVPARYRQARTAPTARAPRTS